MKSSYPIFLSITDLHFDPCYDPEIIDTLLETNPEQWESVFKCSSITQMPVHGQDTNYPLIASLFEELSSYAHAGFVLFSGDFLGHSLQQKFQKAATDKSSDNFKQFISKTIAFLAFKFDQAFPGKAVFPSLGNDDSFSGDYAISPGGEFLDMFTRTWQPLFRQSGKMNQQSFESSFTAGGYYSTPVPGQPGRRLVVLNNIFYKDLFLLPDGSQHDKRIVDRTGLFRSNLYGSIKH